MALITKEYFNKILDELNNSEGMIMDKNLAISCIEEYYPETYIPTNIRTCKSNIVGIFKENESFKLVRLPLHIHQINYKYDERIYGVNGLIIDKDKILTTQDNKNILHRKGW